MTLSASKKYALFFLVLVTCLYSALRGCRIPDRWTSTHYVLNYSEGFCKRGLVGALGHGLLGAKWFVYENLIFIQVFFLVGLVVLFLFLFKKILELNKFSVFFLFVTLAFYLSPSFVFLCHEVGYFEQIGFLITFISILLWGDRLIHSKYLAVTMAVLVGIGLMHEINLILCGCLFASVLLIHENKVLSKRLLLLGAFCYLLSYLIVDWGTLPVLKTQQLKLKLASVTDFSLRSDVFETLYRKLHDNFSIMKRHWENKTNRTYFLQCLLAVIPTTALSFSYLFRLLKQNEKSTFVCVFALALLLSPLPLGLVGYDVNRWCALVLVMSYFICCYATLVLPNTQSVPLSGFVILVFFLVLSFSPKQNYYLFDGYQVKNFPFTEHWKFRGWVKE